jgi:hypothetical protein
VPALYLISPTLPSAALVGLVGPAF